MAARVTIERILRDDDDAVGQTIREWKIEAEPGVGVTIWSKSKDIPLMMRTDDIDTFKADLDRAKAAAAALCTQQGAEK